MVHTKHSKALIELGLEERLDAVERPSKIAYNAKGDYDLAIADYNAAIKLDPNSVYAYYYRGLVYKNQGSKDKAVADFKKVLELNKDRDLSQRASKQLQELSTF
ncbi:tetratricopeptide repeat protein [Mastigocladopsis repens]|uniref:tetratricopeptide repeat protein n=1 Tax=Mastigocladopsis repens TaxID=221287 RepID=UPI0002F2AF95|nr:tetratricopeptide repeat protein [Mastigocladopsis repens]